MQLQEVAGEAVEQGEVPGTQGDGPVEFVLGLGKVPVPDEEQAEVVVMSGFFGRVEDGCTQPLDLLAAERLQVLKARQGLLRQGVVPGLAGESGEAIKGVGKADIEQGGALKGLQGIVLPVLGREALAEVVVERGVVGKEAQGFEQLAGGLGVATRGQVQLAQAPAHG